MKSIMITYNQAHSEQVQDVLDSNHVNGYTKWVDVQGRGSTDGEPHLATHAWPAKNMVTMVIVEDDIVTSLMEQLKEVDMQAPQIGLRAFVWTIDQML